MPTRDGISVLTYAFAYGYGSEVSRIDPNCEREEYGLTFDDLVDGVREDVE